MQITLSYCPQEELFNTLVDFDFDEDLEYQLEALHFSQVVFGWKWILYPK